MALAASIAPANSIIVLDNDECLLQSSIENNPCEPPISSMAVAPFGTGIFGATSFATLIERSLIPSWYDCQSPGDIDPCISNVLPVRTQSSSLAIHSHSSI